MNYRMNYRIYSEKLFMMQLKYYIEQIEKEKMIL
jgi:hypothetical protein